MDTRYRTCSEYLQMICDDCLKDIEGNGVKAGSGMAGIICQECYEKYQESREIMDEIVTKKDKARLKVYGREK